MAEREIIDFSQGLPGFIDKHRFVLIHIAKDSPFIIMQSIEEAKLAFITIAPWDIKGDYEFDISKEIEELLQVDSAEDILVLVICTVRGRPEEMTVNLAAPVIINFKKNLGKQVVLDSNQYSIKHPVFPEYLKREAK